MTADSLFSQLVALPPHAALILPLAITKESAARAIEAVTARHPARRYSVGKHTARPRQAEAVHHVRIERLPDEAD